MNWKAQLAALEHSKGYTLAIKHIQNVIKDNPDDVEAYIRGIYLLHHILVEEDYPELEHDFLAGLLKSYFDISYVKFSNNAEYLFFIGKILHIAEWYFGLNDRPKSISESLAFQMQKKAHEMENGNVLYEWAYRFSLDDKLASYLAEQILLHDKTKFEWLKSKGFPGEYILEALEQSQEQQSL